jgi:hypothetical protein
MPVRGEKAVPSALVFSQDAVITESADGGVEITSSEMHTKLLNDWNDADSKSRRRYGHLLEGR